MVVPGAPRAPPCGRIFPARCGPLEARAFLLQHAAPGDPLHWVVGRSRVRGRRLHAGAGAMPKKLRERGRAGPGTRGDPQRRSPPPRIRAALLSSRRRRSRPFPYESTQRLPVILLILLILHIVFLCAVGASKRVRLGYRHDLISVGDVSQRLTARFPAARWRASTRAAADGSAAIGLASDDLGARSARAGSRSRHPISAQTLRAAGSMLNDSHN